MDYCLLGESYFQSFRPHSCCFLEFPIWLVFLFISLQKESEILISLEIEKSQELASLVRLRLADDEPLSVEHSLLVHNYCPGVLEQDYANRLAKAQGIAGAMTGKGQAAGTIRQQAQARGQAEAAGRHGPDPDGRCLRLPQLHGQRDRPERLRLDQRIH